MWKVFTFVEPGRLERVLNDLAPAGYEVYQICYNYGADYYSVIAKKPDEAKAGATFTLEEVMASAAGAKVA